MVPRRATRRLGYKSLSPQCPASDQHRSGTVVAYCANHLPDIAVPALPTNTPLSGGTIRLRSLHQFSAPVQHQLVVTEVPALPRRISYLDQVNHSEPLNEPP